MPGSHLGQHVTFSRVTSGSPWPWQFLRLFFFFLPWPLITLVVLRRPGPVFCRTSLIRDLSLVLLKIKMELRVLERKASEIKCLRWIGSGCHTNTTDQAASPTEIYSLPVLEAGASRAGFFWGLSLSLAYRWPSSPCVLAWSSLHVLTSSSEEDLSSIGLGPAPWSHVTLMTSLKILSPNTVTFWGAAS